MAFLSQLQSCKGFLRPTVTQHKTLLSDETIKEMFNSEHLFINIPSWRFSADTKSWVKYDFDDTPGGIKAARTSSKISLVTYNIWFSDKFLAARMKELGKILGALQPDVIALQEVKPHILESHILNWDWVKDYYLSDVTGKTLIGYGVVLLSRFPFHKLSSYNLPTRMGRKLIVGEILTPDGTLVIGSSHLESYAEDTLWRAKQMEAIKKLLEPHPHSIMMGDFNIVREEEISAQFPSPMYVDPWTLLHPLEAGETTTLGRVVSSENETGISSETPKTSVARIDRILIKSGYWSPREITRLGMEPILIEQEITPKSGEPPFFSELMNKTSCKNQSSVQTPKDKEKEIVYPSDHFGLMVCIELD